MRDDCWSVIHAHAFEFIHRQLYIASSIQTVRVRNGESCKEKKFQKNSGHETLGVMQARKMWHREPGGPICFRGGGAPFLVDLGPNEYLSLLNY